MTTAEPRDVRIARTAKHVIAHWRTRIADAMPATDPAEEEKNATQTPPTDRINHLAQEWEQNRPKTD
jgi:hypothetical protein